MKIKDWFKNHIGKVIAIVFINQEDGQYVKLLDFDDNWFFIQYATGNKEIVNRNIIKSVNEGDKIKFDSYFKRFKEDPTFRGDLDTGYKFIKKSK